MSALWDIAAGLTEETTGAVEDDHQRMCVHVNCPDRDQTAINRIHKQLGDPPLSSCNGGGRQTGGGRNPATMRSKRLAGVSRTHCSLSNRPIGELPLGWGISSFSLCWEESSASPSSHEGGTESDGESPLRCTMYGTGPGGRTSQACCGVKMTSPVLSTVTS